MLIVRLTEEELQIVKKALGKFPYENVAPLMVKFDGSITEEEYKEFLTQKKKDKS